MVNYVSTCWLITLLKPSLSAKYFFFLKGKLCSAVVLLAKDCLLFIFVRLADDCLPKIASSKFDISCSYTRVLGQIKSLNFSLILRVSNLLIRFFSVSFGYSRIAF